MQHADVANNEAPRLIIIAVFPLSWLTFNASQPPPIVAKCEHPGESLLKCYLANRAQVACRWEDLEGNLAAKAWLDRALASDCISETRFLSLSSISLVFHQRRTR
jgi:hypothetical protein